jgi:hypothetical protein
MGHGALTPLLGGEFDDFLFASIGEDRNGTALSVLWALARLDVDPWQETASLARIPRGRATQRLAALIAAAPKQWRRVDPRRQSPFAWLLIGAGFHYRSAPQRPDCIRFAGVNPRL